MSSVIFPRIKRIGWIFLGIGAGLFLGMAVGLLIVFRFEAVGQLSMYFFTVFDALAVILAMMGGMSGWLSYRKLTGKSTGETSKQLLGLELLLFIAGGAIFFLGAFEMIRHRSYYVMHLFPPLSTFLQVVFFSFSGLFIFSAIAGIMGLIVDHRTKLRRIMPRYLQYQITAIGFIFLLLGGIAVPYLIAVLRLGNYWTSVGFQNSAYDLPTGAHRNPILDDPQVNQSLLAILERVLWSMTRVQQQGGFPMVVTPDGSQYYGDRGKVMPYYPGECSLQGSTGNIGSVYLAMYQVEPNIVYLNVSSQVAQALMAVQDPENGGFYYDGWIRPDGTAVHPHPLNPTRSAILDDNTMQSCMNFLLEYYNLTKDPAVLASLMRGFACIDAMETPIGGWMQRSKYDLEDYPSRATLNDGCLRNTVSLYLKAYDILGEARFLAAAQRAGEFLIYVQGQGGSSLQQAWAEQYTYEGFPAWGRVFEPPGFSPDATRDAIEVLLMLYEKTGNTTYLAPIPNALVWLMDSSTILHEEQNGMNLTYYARLYEQQTNRPIYGLDHGGEGRWREYTYKYEQARQGYTWHDNFSIPYILNRVQYFASTAYNLTLMDAYENPPINLYWMEQSVIEVVSDLDASGFWIEEGLIQDRVFWTYARLLIQYFIAILAQF